MSTGGVTFLMFILAGSRSEILAYQIISPCMGAEGGPDEVKKSTAIFCGRNSPRLDVDYLDTSHDSHEGSAREKDLEKTRERSRGWIHQKIKHPYGGYLA